ncbi:MAG TPA: hypothetical protein EYP10_02290 [Armatimonadetes bacterium]|nr:hypothetical protein [Armatimonadota bacterium]
MVREIIYFDRPGAQNTDELVHAVAERCRELGIKHIVVASDSGATALKVWEAVKDLGIQLISVAEHAGYAGGDEPSISVEQREQLERHGIKVLICSHALSGIGRSITNKFGGVTPVEIIAHTLRLFGQGMKVAVEVAVMAADAGLIPTDCEVVAIGGTGSGADCAVVIKAAHMNNFFDFEVREVIAMPRAK